MQLRESQRWNVRDACQSAAVFGAALLTGCVTNMVAAPIYGNRVGDVHVSAISVDKANSSSSTFCIFPAEDSTSSSDLVYVDLKTKLTKALISKGFKPAETADTCLQAIFLGYGYGMPRTSIGTRSISAAASSAQPIAQESALANELTRAKDDFHQRWLVVTSADLSQLKRDGTVHELWNTVAIAYEDRSTVKQRDVRFSATYLMAASTEYFGRHANEQTIHVRTRDDSYELLRNNED